MTDPTPVPELTPDGDPSILGIPMPPAPPDYEFVIDKTTLPPYSLAADLNQKEVK